MRRYMLPLLAATTLGVASLVPATAQKADVAGSVNGVVITWSQLLKRLRTESEPAYRAAIAQAAGTLVFDGLYGKNPKKQVIITEADAIKSLKNLPLEPTSSLMNVMMQEEALRQAVAKAGVQVTDAQVDGYLKSILKDARGQGRIPPNVTDEQFLQQQKIDPVKIKVRLRPQLQALNLVQKEMEKNYGHPIGPDDFVQARHILLQPKPAAPEAKPEDVKKADQELLDKIKVIETDIRGGKKKFEDAAKESSEDTSNKDKGGDLGVFMRGMMVKEFENAAFGLKTGDLSQPIRTQFGYHIIKVDKSGKDITPEEREKVLNMMKQRQLQGFLQGLMQRSKIVNNVKAPAQNPNAMRMG